MPLRVSYLRYLIAETWSGPPSGRDVHAHSSARARHGGTRMAHMVGLLVSRPLGLVGRRAPRAKRAVRARNPNGWPTFPVDEKGLLDGAPATTWMLRKLMKWHGAVACYCVSIAFLSHSLPL